MKKRLRMKLAVLVCFLLNVFSSEGYTFSKLYCYQCVSTHPGCGSPFNWWYYWSQMCPEDNDKCVKIIERKGATEVVTRDCLSTVRSFRTDIPADHYEGCRSSVEDVKLAQYVNNSIKELDVKRNHYDSTEWCFCHFDNRCNSAVNLQISLSFIFIYLIIYLAG